MENNEATAIVKLMTAGTNQTMFGSRYNSHVCIIKRFGGWCSANSKELRIGALAQRKADKSTSDGVTNVSFQSINLHGQFVLNF